MSLFFKKWLCEAEIGCVRKKILVAESYSAWLCSMLDNTKFGSKIGSKKKLYFPASLSLATFSELACGAISANYFLSSSLPIYFLSSPAALSLPIYSELAFGAIAAHIF